MSEHIYSLDEIFAAVLPLLKKYHAERAILFGSYARQEADAAYRGRAALCVRETSGRL